MSEINRILAGRYQLLELIGQGGMADVYKADDLILHRDVAVKVLRSSLTGDPIYITRFHREARAAAAITHKNIVDIYDVGEEDDLYYIVMEYVQGQTLKALINKRGAMHYAEAVDIMIQIADAAATAHKNGIIHRDLKPQNIMVTDAGLVKITDFGIASIQSLSQVTQTNTVMGSLHYLAPELARGEKASFQSDIYSLGIILYELLRGEVPFNGESPVNIALKHMRDDIPSVRDFNRSIPQSLENIIIKATAKNVKNRYESAEEMVEDLRTCLKRPNEEKLIFPPAENEPTIVAGGTQFFENTDVKENTGVTINETSNYTTTKTRKKKKKKYIKKLLALLVAALMIGMAGFAVITFTKPKSGTLPNVIGLPKEDAVAGLEAAGYKVDDESEEELSDKFEKGLVIRTSPEADERVKKGTTIKLTLSKGKWIVVRDYTGMKYEDAEAELKELGFKVEKYEQTDDEYAKGLVIDQSISSGEKKDPNDTNKIITLTVSKGILITVPSVYGQSISSARKTLRALGFKVRTSVLKPPTSEREIASMSINTVVKQSLDPYTTVTKKGVRITLYYYDKKPDVSKSSSSQSSSHSESSSKKKSSSSESKSEEVTEHEQGD